MMTKWKNKNNSGDDKTNANYITYSRNAIAVLAILSDIINKSTSIGDKLLFPLISDLNRAATENKWAGFWLQSS